MRSVKGLEDFPRANWPPVPVVHYAFELMVACGTFLAAIGFIFIFRFLMKKDILFKTWFLKLLVFCTPLGFIALEAGWTVTEVGRQPWIIYGIMKTKDALTPMPGLIVPIYRHYFIIYILSSGSVWLMVRQFKQFKKVNYLNRYLYALGSHRISVISLLFYCVFGGADFGAGALEFFVPKNNRKRHEELVNKAMGPVWEANHIWLIILIVILFNAFPQVYTQYSIYFHVPLILMLIGIVFRGCAFTFRQL